MKRKYQLILSLLVFAFFNTTSLFAQNGSVRATQFEIKPATGSTTQVISDGKFLRNGKTDFTAEITFMKFASVTGPEFEIVIFSDGKYTELSTTQYKNSWGSDNIWTTTISGSLPASITSGIISLRYRYYVTSSNVPNTLFSETQYQIYIPSDPGSPPSYTPPMSNAYPIWCYSQQHGGVYLTPSWEGQTPQYRFASDVEVGSRYYAGILGYYPLNNTDGAEDIFLYRNYANGDQVYGFANTSVGNGYHALNPIWFKAYRTPGPNRIPVYSYLVWNEYHHYSTDIDFTQDGYQREGIIFYVLGNTNTTAPLEGTVNWYGFFHPGVGNHYNTTSNGNYPGYIYDGVVGRVFPTQHPGTVALYQYFNPTVVDHCYYTANTSIPGYQNQGVQCYVYTTPQPGTIPIYGYFNPSSGDHYYNRGTQTPSGYVAEGIQFYVGP